MKQFALCGEPSSRAQKNEALFCTIKISFMFSLMETLLFVMLPSTEVVVTVMHWTHFKRYSLYVDWDAKGRDRVFLIFVPSRQIPGLHHDQFVTASSKIISNSPVILSLDAV